MHLDDFDALLAVWQDRIRALASRLARGNRDLAADLEQTGRIALWECRAERAYRNQEAWIYRVVRNRMIDVVRTEGRARVITPEAQPSGRRRRAAGDRPRSRRNMVPRHWNAMPEDDFDDIPVGAERGEAGGERGSGQRRRRHSRRRDDGAMRREGSGLP